MIKLHKVKVALVCSCVALALFLRARLDRPEEGIDASLDDIEDDVSSSTECDIIYVPSIIETTRGHNITSFIDLLGVVPSQSTRLIN